jgi:hypothetical protein
MKTPNEIRQQLTRKLALQRVAANTAGSYYAGTQALQFLDPEIARMTAGRLKTLNVNFARLAIDSLESRIQVSAFATTPGGAADPELWKIWQASNMDEQSQLAHLDALIFGRAYFMAGANSDGSPRLSAESSLQCAVHRDPITREITAALKQWRDDDGFTHAYLMTPNEVSEYVSTSSLSLDPLFTGQPSNLGDAFTLVRTEPNPLGVVPFVALVNRPRLQTPDGESELTDIMPLIDGIAKLSTDLMVSAEYSASPRRYVTGIAPTDATQAQMDEVADQIKKRWERAHAAKFLIAPNADTRFGQFDTPSLSNYISSIEMLSSQIAAIASLPPQYLSLLNSAPTSADAIRASESRLTAKVKRRTQTWSGAYEELMRLAVLIRDGQTDPRLQDMETLWVSAETSTLAQTADAETKLYAAGVIDQRTALSALDYSPQEIDRIIDATQRNGAIA